MPTVRVIGCGTPDAGDDAVGLLAVRACREALVMLGDVDVRELASPLDAVHLLEGADAVVVVDAIRAPTGGREPGELVRAEGGPDGLPAELRSSLSSHGLGLAEAMGLAAALGRPPRIVFVGVEAGDVTAGRPLSPAVAGALPRLVDLVMDEVAHLRGRA